MALSLLAAFAAGAGLVFLLEMLDMTIRRSTDVYSLVDSQLVVAIPYITTKSEQIQSKRRLQFVIIAGILALVAMLLVVYLVMPPLDLIIAKARVGLFR
jgi:capsular polysaccharide biosynthesis protein